MKTTVHSATVVFFILLFVDVIQASDSIEIGNDVKLREYQDGLSNMVYIPHPYETMPYGTLTAWKFYSYRKGTISLQVWRFTGTSTYYTLVGETVVIIDSVGEQIVYADYLTVKEGDVVGFYFRGHNIIPFSACPFSESVSLYEAKPSRESMIPGQLSHFYPMKKNNNWKPCRHYSLKAVVFPGFVLHGNPVIERSDIDNLKNMVIIPDPLQTLTYGILQGWKLYARIPGIVYLQIWRRNGRKMEYRLVSHTRYQVHTAGVHSIDAEKFDSLSDDDVIGFYFPGKNVIPFDGMKCPIDKGMHIYKPSAQGVKIGESYVFHTNPKILEKCRQYSLTALTLPVSPGNMYFGHETIDRKLMDISSRIIFIPNPSKKLHEGTLKFWRFYTRSIGTIYLQVWRHVGLFKYKLISNTKYTVKHVGIKTIEGSKSSNIKSGDVIGFYTPGDSVIPFDGVECANNEGGLYAADPKLLLKIGTTIGFKKIANGWKQCRMYSLETIIRIV